MRLLNATGSLRVRHWRLFGERDLARKQAAMWLNGETLTIEHATESLTQYRVAVESNDRRMRAMTEPRIYAIKHRSPQPFLASLEKNMWHPARRLAPYRPRRRREEDDAQAPLFVLEKERVNG